MRAEVIAVSCDTQFVHLAWLKYERERANVKFQMAVDSTGNLAKMFGVYDEGTGQALRSIFIINPEVICPIRR